MESFQAARALRAHLQKQPGGVLHGGQAGSFVIQTGCTMRFKALVTQYPGILQWAGANVVQAASMDECKAPISEAEAKAASTLGCADLQVLDVISDAGQCGVVLKVKCVRPVDNIPDDRVYALKLLYNYYGLDKHGVASRFKSEHEFLTSIQHPNIVRCLRQFVERVPFGWLEYLPPVAREKALELGFPATQFVLMEHHGCTLLERLTSDTPQDTRLQWCLDVARGVEALRSSHILHLDLKPDNVLLSRDGHAVICDLGMARSFDPAAAGWQVHVEGDDSVGGNTLHLAPEVLTAAGGLPCTVNYAGQASFELGVICYEILGGCHPIATYGSKHTYSDADICRLPAIIPEELQLLLLNLVSCDAANRLPISAAILCLSGTLRQLLLSRDNQRLRSEAAAGLRNVDILRATQVDLQRQVQHIKSERQKTLSENAQLASSLQRSEAERQKAVSEKQRIEKQLQIRQSEVTNLERRQKDWEDYAQSIETKWQSAVSDGERLKAKLQKAETAEQTATSENALLALALQSMETKWQSAVSDGERLKAKLQKAETAEQTATSENALLALALQSMKTQWQSAVSNGERLKANLRHLENAKEDVLAENFGLQRQLHSVQSEQRNLARIGSDQRRELQASRHCNEILQLILAVAAIVVLLLLGWHGKPWTA